MKTSVSKRASRLGASLGLGLVLLAAMSASASAQTVATVPVGAVTLNIAAGPSTTVLGLPMKAPSLFTGAVSSVTASTITFSGTPLVSGGYSSAASPFYAIITTGAQAGRTLKVTANDTSSITVDITDGTASSVGLDAAGLAVAAGDKVELTPADTLASLLGTGAGLKITGGTSAVGADTVGLWNGARFVSYFYNTTAGFWVQSGFNAVNENNHVIAPNEGISINRKTGRGAVALTVTGVVQDHNMLYRHNGAGTLIVTQKYPTDVTLGSLSFAAPGTLVSSTSILSSDTVGIWNGARFVSYYKNSTSGKWVTQADSVTDNTNLVISAGQPVAILRRTAKTGTAQLLGYARPYSDPKL